MPGNEPVIGEAGVAERSGCPPDPDKLDPYEHVVDDVAQGREVWRGAGAGRDGTLLSRQVVEKLLLSVARNAAALDLIDVFASTAHGLGRCFSAGFQFITLLRPVVGLDAPFLVVPSDAGQPERRRPLPRRRPAQAPRVRA